MNRPHDSLSSRDSALSRRFFLGGLGALSAAITSSSSAAPTPQVVTHETPVLTGKDFDLVIGESLVNYNGLVRTAVTVNGSLPGPTLVWTEGDTVTIRVKNTLATDTAIHWHGILLPFQMDGVPGISFKGIRPGETFTYTFPVRQQGTYWYHSHAGFQEMKGLSGAIIIKPKSALAKPLREHVIQLSDWTDDNPLSLFARLKIHSDFNNFIAPTVPDFVSDVKKFGLEQAMELRKMWHQMRMNPTDLADLSRYSLNYLLNGKNADRNWTGLFEKGERLLLRFINTSSSTFYDVRIPGLKMTVIEADGLPVAPVSVDEFRFGSGETFAVTVMPTEDVYTVFAQSMDRTGFARGTLAVREGLTAPVPKPDAPQWLTMMDMGHPMGDMDHSKMEGMDHSQMDHSKMGHSQPALAAPSSKVRHATTEYGPSVDMRVDNPRMNLDDPGVGLRDNGRRVLTLADLRSLGGAPDTRKATKEIELHLTGNMERYVWSLDGLEFGKSTPVHFPAGEKIRVTLHNDTMMTHPMHLHGMWSDILAPDGSFLVRKHTFAMQPAQRITFEVTADAPGRWAWHCHLLFHMHAGMFREVIVA